MRTAAAWKAGGGPAGPCGQCRSFLLMANAGLAIRTSCLSRCKPREGDELLEPQNVDKSGYILRIGAGTDELSDC